MTSGEERLHRQGVTELTTLLRNDPMLEDLRQVLRRRRLRPEETLLASLMENGDGIQVGALVTGDGRVIEYERRIDLHRRGPRVLRWRDRTNDPLALVDHPQLRVALMMRGTATGAGGLLRYFERIGNAEGAELCRRWLDLQSKSTGSKQDINTFLKDLEREQERNPGSGWTDLEMQFQDWARSQGEA